MKISASRAVLLATALTSSPIRSLAAEGPAATGFEWWRLRPLDVTTTGTTGSITAGRQASERRAPEAAERGAAPERRPVRVVYPGLTAGP